MTAKATYTKLSLAIFEDQRTSRKAMAGMAESGIFAGQFAQLTFSEAAANNIAASELGFTEDFIKNDETFSKVDEKEIRECCLEMQKGLNEKIINAISDKPSESNNSYLKGLKKAHTVMTETLKSY